jgi:hypothetical protein
MAKMIPSLGLRFARAAVRALQLQEQSYCVEKNRYTSDIVDCVMQACREEGMVTGEWFIIYLAIQWSNDIQYWHKHLEENPGSNSEDFNLDVGDHDVAKIDEFSNTER